MSDHEHARQMVGLAERDYRALGVMADAEAVADEIFGFHAQQTVEKALKAWLSLRHVKYPRVHDLEELLGLLIDEGEDATGFQELTWLTAFAVAFRYESVSDEREALDRQALTDDVSALLAHVQELVEEAGD